MAKVLKIDKDTCIGCGLCASLAPATFKINDDNKAEVLDPQGAGEEKIQEAIDSCPVSAIISSES